ncbi:MAG: azurin [Pseudomonadota bacterium]
MLTKNIPAFLVLAASMTLVACGSGDDATPSSAAAEAATEAANDAADTVAEDAQDVVEDAADAATDAIDDAADAVADAADDAADAMADAADDMNDTMADAEETVSDMVDDAAATVAGDSDAPAASGDCALTIEAGDRLGYNTDSLTAAASCSEVTVTLVHTGKLPKNAMGHNWVLVKKSDLDAVGAAGMTAGIDNSYVPVGDDRIIAATQLIGGGETSSTTVDMSVLDADTEYAFICTFPGHWSIMRGSFTIG